MSALRWMAAVGFGATMTLGQLLLVAALNGQPPAAAEPSGTLRPLPVEALPPPPPPRPREPDDSTLEDPTDAAAETSPGRSPAEPAAPRDLTVASRSGEHWAGAGSLDLGSLLPPVDGAGPPGVALPEAPGDAPADRPARASHRPAPRYPERARRRGVEGVVTLRLRVEADGRVSSVVVVAASPPGVFEGAARAAARGYRFEPAVVNGERAATTVEQRVVFRLKR